MSRARRNVDVLSGIEEGAHDPKSDLATLLRKCITLGGLTGSIAAMQRDSDGSLAAHTIAQRWHQQFPAREAARTADRRLQHAERFWNRQTGSWPAAFREDLARREPEVVRVLARLSTDSERVSVVAQALRLAPSGEASDFVSALHRCAARAPRLATPVDAQRAGRAHRSVR